MKKCHKINYWRTFTIILSGWELNSWMELDTIIYMAKLWRKPRIFFNIEFWVHREKAIVQNSNLTNSIELTHCGPLGWKVRDLVMDLQIWVKTEQLFCWWSLLLNIGVATYNAKVHATSDIPPTQPSYSSWELKLREHTNFCLPIPIGQ